MYMKMKTINQIGLIAILAILCCSLAAGNILEINLRINKDDSVTGDIKVSIGASSTYRNESGNYLLKILDAAGNRIWSKSYNLKFVVLTNPGTFTDFELVNEKIGYDRRMYELRLYRNNSMIYKRYLDFCDSNGICDKNENSISCPEDCDIAIKDNLCTAFEDNVCDPDCIEGRDIDCREVEAKRKQASISLAFLFIMLAALIAAALFEREKLKPIATKLKSAVTRVASSEFIKACKRRLKAKKEAAFLVPFKSAYLLRF